MKEKILEDKYDIIFISLWVAFKGLELETSDADTFIFIITKIILMIMKSDDFYNLIRNKKPLYCPYKLRDIAKLPFDPGLV